MDRPREMNEDFIPMVSAVALSRYQEVLKYARYLEENIVKFQKSWIAGQPYATNIETVDNYREAIDSLVRIGKEISENELRAAKDNHD